MINIKMKNIKDINYDEGDFIIVTKVKDGEEKIIMNDLWNDATDESLCMWFGEVESFETGTDDNTLSNLFNSYDENLKCHVYGIYRLYVMGFDNPRV